MTKSKKMIDDETLVFLEKQKSDDTQTVSKIMDENQVNEFRKGHIDRCNQFKTSQIQIKSRQQREADFLEDLYKSEMTSTLERQAEEAAAQKEIFDDERKFNALVNEMKSMAVQSTHNKAAAERLKRTSHLLKERRQTVIQHLARIEARQERERKSLKESHSRNLKQKRLFRSVILRDVEDPEIRIILSGKEFNSATLSEENENTAATKSEDDKKFQAFVLAQIVIDTKELEHLREEQLVFYKYSAKYCEKEIEIIEENEALIAEHLLKEVALEASQKLEIDAEEDRISTDIYNLVARQTEEFVRTAAKKMQEEHRKEAKKLKLQQSKEAQQRENEFWEHEETQLRNFLKAKGLENDYQTIQKHVFDRSDSENSKLEEYFDDVDDADSDTLSKDANSNIEAYRAKELAHLEDKKKEHRLAVRRMKALHLKIREKTRNEHQKSLKAIIASRDDDILALKNDQKREMEALRDSFNNNKAKENDQASLYESLPKSVAEILSTGQKFNPKTYDGITVMTATISNMGKIASECGYAQAMNLMNNVYSALDSVLKSTGDINRIDTGGNTYCLVGGLSQNSNPKQVAINMTNLAFTLSKKARDLVTSYPEKLELQIGLESGSAVGGVHFPNSIPKFSLIGEVVTLSGLLEETSSSAKGIHVSERVHSYVQDRYESQEGESVRYRGESMPTYWIHEDGLGEKTTRDTPSSF